MDLHNFEEIKWTELENALSELCLKWITIGDYVVVMNNKCDVTIGGEPYLVLQLWFNVKSGKMIKRIWDQTISSGNVAEVSQFVEACSLHFKGRPCVGLPVPINEISWKKYLISQTPMPRKISKTCRKTLGPSTDTAVKSCPDCVMLNETHIMENGSNTNGPCPSVNNDTNVGGLKTVAHQATYLQEIAKKYPHILKAGKQFRIKIKTEDSKGILVQKVLLVDPTQTLQQGGIVQTLSENDINNADDRNVRECGGIIQGETNLPISEKELLESKHDFTSTGELYKDAEKTFEQHEEFDLKTKEYDCDPDGLHDTQPEDTCREVIDPKKRDDMQTIFHPQRTGPHYCTLCSKGFTKSSDLKRHKRTIVHHERAKQISQSRGVIPPDEDDHITLRPPNKTKPKNPQAIACETCGKICPSRFSLHAHRSREHEQISFHKKCEICNKVYSCRVFRKHMKKDHGMNGTFEIQCYWCKKAYSTKSYMDHAKKEHFYGIFFCEKCNYCGNIARDLIDHVNEKHEGVTSVKCPSCKKDHPIEHLEAQYKECIRNEFHGDKICSACGKTLKGKGTLQSHKKFHCSGQATLRKNFCDKCGQKFSSPNYLRVHIKVAHESFAFQCEFCPMTFNSRAKYYSHKNISHSTDAKYQCKFCGLRFGNVRLLKTHERKHQEPAFQCSFCERKMKTPESLEYHERLHTGEKPHMCSICNSGFASLASLRQHEGGVHKIEGRKGRPAGWFKGKKKKRISTTAPSALLTNN